MWCRGKSAAFYALVPGADRQRQCPARAGSLEDPGARWHASIMDGTCHRPRARPLRVGRKRPLRHHRGDRSTTTVERMPENGARNHARTDSRASRKVASRSKERNRRGRNVNKKDTTKAATHTPGASRTSPLFGRSRTIPSRVSAMPASVIKTAVHPKGRSAAKEPRRGSGRRSRFRQAKRIGKHARRATDGHGG